MIKNFRYFVVSLLLFTWPLYFLESLADEIVCETERKLDVKIDKREAGSKSYYSLIVPQVFDGSELRTMRVRLFERNRAPKPGFFKSNLEYEIDDGYAFSGFVLDDEKYSYFLEIVYLGDCVSIYNFSDQE